MANQGGERVVKTASKKSAKKAAGARSFGFRFVSEDETAAARDDDALGELTGRRVVLGIATLVPLTQIARLVKGALLPSKAGEGASGDGRRGKRGARGARPVDDEFDEGDAVTAPALETLFLQKAAGLDLGLRLETLRADTNNVDLTAAARRSRRRSRSSRSAAARSRRRLRTGRWVCRGSAAGSECGPRRRRTRRSLAGRPRAA